MTPLSTTPVYAHVLDHMDMTNRSGTLFVQGASVFFPHAGFRVDWQDTPSFAYWTLNTLNPNLVRWRRYQQQALSTIPLLVMERVIFRSRFDWTTERVSKDAQELLIKTLHLDFQDALRPRPHLQRVLGHIHALAWLAGFRQPDTAMQVFNTRRPLVFADPTLSKGRAKVITRMVHRLCKSIQHTPLHREGGGDGFLALSQSGMSFPMTTLSAHQHLASIVRVQRAPWWPKYQEALSKTP